MLNYFKKLRLPNRYFSTLYGTLCLVSQIEDLNTLSDNYGHVLEWLSQSLYWLINKSYSIQANSNLMNSTESGASSDLECINIVLNKIFKLFFKNTKILIDTIPYVATLAQSGKQKKIKVYSFKKTIQCNVLLCNV